MSEDASKKEVPKKICSKCDKSKATKNSFYISSSSNYKDGYYPVCKQCLKEGTDYSDMEQVHSLLLELNKPFLFTIWEKSQEESKKTNRDLFGIYLKNVNLNNRTLTWKDSDFNNPDDITEVEQISNEVNETKIELDNRNKDDVLRMLGYDPFEGESPDDKRHLYNKLVDFLDESTLEDSFKLPAVIEIVKGFNQIDKINRALASITNDINNLTKNTGGIKSLIDSKEKILKSILALAKDNGISVNHNNNKSKGGGTLSGIIKNLQEKGFEEADLNLFDIETSDGMRQVADISNKSIAAQLQFDENDYTLMITEQREMIDKLEKAVSKLEEENRVLKKDILKRNKNEVET